MNRWLARNVVYRAAIWARGEPVFTLLSRLLESQWWEQAKLLELQKAAVTDLLRFSCAESPYYAELALRNGLIPSRMTFDDLERLPVLTKQLLVEQLERIRVPNLHERVSWKTTGGSLGLPVTLAKSRLAVAAEQAASWRSYGWYGIQPGDRQARFWGTPLRARARWRYRIIDAVMNRVRFSAFAFSQDDMRRYFRRLAAAKIDWGYGYVSMLRQFAEFCLENGLPLASVGLRAVVTTSEVLTDGDRSVISRAFGCPVFNEYGCGEVGPILYECERGSLHLMAENIVAETLPDPTPEQPDACRLVITDLYNRATPLIRYDIGDRVVPAGQCVCGRGLPAFTRVFGRAYDMITASNGRRFHGEFFLYSLEAARDRGLRFRQAQFVQVSPSRIDLYVVPADGYTQATGAWIAQEVESRSSGLFSVRVHETPEIARERSGKIRLVKALAGTVASESA